MITVGTKVRFIDKPSLGVGTVLEVSPALGWRSGYVMVQFTVPGYERPWRVGFDEVEVAVQPVNDPTLHELSDVWKDGGK